MSEKTEIARAIRKQLAREALQYTLVTGCSLAAVALVAHNATHFINAKLGAVLAALKHFQFHH